MWSVWLVFCDCCFHSVCPLVEKGKRLIEVSWWERLSGKLGLVLMGRAILSKSLIQFSVDGWGCIPSLLFDLKPKYGGGNEDNGDLLRKVRCTRCPSQCPRPCSRPLQTHTSARDWNAKAGSREIPGVTGKFGLGVQNKAGQSLTRFCQENALVIANTHFQQHQEKTTHGRHQMSNWYQIDYILCSQRWGSSIQSAKKKD